MAREEREGYTPPYEYAKEAEGLVPGAGKYPNQEELRKRAEAQERRILKILRGRKVNGGRAG